MTLVIAFLLAAAPASDLSEERFERANALYRAGDFGAAATEYEALLASGLASPALHLNLGNARSRLGLRGPAVASWERALRLDPGDEDARANLLAIRADDPDRALTGEPAFLARLAARTGDGTATALFLIPWWLLWGALALRARRSGRSRQALGASALAASLAILLGGLVLAARARDGRFPAAVVVAPSTQVREGPSPALRAAFELHEGTKVRVREVAGDRVRVRLDGGLEGWMARRDLEVL